MKARLVKIGNSRGIRLPKPVIEEAGLSEEVEVRVRGGAVVISAASRPRISARKSGDTASIKSNMRCDRSTVRT